MDENRLEFDFQSYSAKYLEILQQIIMTPASFYRQMSKSGGLVDPLVFMVVMSIAAGLIRAILGIVGIGFAGSFSAALASIILIPVFTVIFGFIGAAILFVIWKAMGSQEPFEVAFRCFAYAAAISPITAVVNAIPYIGAVLGLVWMTYLLVTASKEVHNLQPRLSWIVFGAICAILSIASINAQITARNMAKRLGAAQNRFGQINQMKPEEAGKALGEFMKGVQKGSR
ncbi:MAG: YIP1 family protein [Syntrophobacteraceae bacterium]|nr:YIP1 family protein [Syntrophobacteraceae bacterium]